MACLLAKATRKAAALDGASQVLVSGADAIPVEVLMDEDGKRDHVDHEYRSMTAEYINEHPKEMESTLGEISDLKKPKQP